MVLKGVNSPPPRYILNIKSKVKVGLDFEVELYRAGCRLENAV
jgi:hypothetical protein